MRILVTGVTGFVGGWLCESLLGEGTHQLAGVSRSGRWPSEWQHLTGRVDLRACDVCDGNKLESILRQFKPERIFHLAGYAQPGRSFQEPDAAWQGNLTATRTLYDAVARSEIAVRIVAVSSGHVYGESRRPAEALDEDSPFRPASPYAASKAAADLIGYQYTRSHNLDIVRARPFNHIGPRQSAQFAVASFARQVAEIMRGKRPPVIETGNLESERDMTDVRDVIAAYLLLAEKGRCGEAYNVGSGRAHSMQHVLDELLDLAGVKVEIRQRADLLRPADPSRACVNIRRLKAETGWQPRFSLRETLQDILTYWSMIV